MRRSSADPGPAGKSNKELLRRRITLPTSGTVLSLLSNGQAVSESNVVNGDHSPRPELRKSNVDVTSLSVGSSAYTANPQTLTFTDFDLHKSRTAIANLHHKIHHTLELIRMEQQVQADNVNEYLESVKSDRPNSQHTKSVFEKKNQKSTQAIMVLQGKLETHQKKLAEVQTHGTSGPKDVLKGLNGFASPVVMASTTMVTKPVEFANMLKQKLGSTDNVSAGGSNEGIRGSFDESEQEMPLAGVHHSVGNNASAVDNRQEHIGLQPRSSSLHAPVKGLPPAGRQSSVPRSLQDINENNEELRNAIAALKVQMHAEIAEMKQTLELDKELCDRLEGHLNDLTELHQNEMANIKQEMISLEEKMQYTLDDRTRDLHELLENCLQRVAKVEQQQHLQLIQTEGSEGSFSFAKIISLVVAFISFCLIVLSTLASLVSPFLSSRLRYFLTIAFIMFSIFAYKNWDYVSHVASAFANVYLLPWLPDFFRRGNGTTGNHGK